MKFVIPVVLLFSEDEQLVTIKYHNETRQSVQPTAFNTILLVNDNT